MRKKELLKRVKKYYEGKLDEYGPSPKGVDWNSKKSQYIRFDQLIRAFDLKEPFSILDYGCGYGELVDFISENGYEYKYYGYDLSEDMISKAKEIHERKTNTCFITDMGNVPSVEYVVASGVFNVKMDIPPKEWKKYVVSTLEKLDSKSEKGFSFNILTEYSDDEYMRSDLYYADPCYYFRYCRANFSKYVSLIHDYPLYEFTISVLKR